MPCESAPSGGCNTVLQCSAHVQPWSPHLMHFRALGLGEVELSVSAVVTQQAGPYLLDAEIAPCLQVSFSEKPQAPAVNGNSGGDATEEAQSAEPAAQES